MGSPYSISIIICNSKRRQSRFLVVNKITHKKALILGGNEFSANKL